MGVKQDSDNFSEVKGLNRIALLTSGGDAPGMNAAIRAVVRTAIYNGIEVIGVEKGYSGLIDGHFHAMTLGSVADIIHRGGTILQTSRCPEFQTEKGREKALRLLKEQEVDALVVIGGDGTFRGAVELEKLGFTTVGIPGTIDNDIPCTDSTIGFDTVVNTVVDAINKIRDTATSHERVFLIEVMGRKSGYIALASGLAGGAESILIPELSSDINVVIDNIKRGMSRGKRHSIILVAEGVGHIGDIAKEIEEKTQMDTRISILGYIQRGGSPSAQDRILASKMGAEAVNCLLRGERKKMIAYLQGSVVSFDLEYALQQQKGIKLEDFQLAGILSR